MSRDMTPCDCGHPRANHGEGYGACFPYDAAGALVSCGCVMFTAAVRFGGPSPACPICAQVTCATTGTPGEWHCGDCEHTFRVAPPVRCARCGDADYGPWLLPCTSCRTVLCEACADTAACCERGAA